MLLYIPLDILTIRLHKQLNKVKVILKQVSTETMQIVTSDDK
jgi:hypothetical protein